MPAAGVPCQRELLAILDHLPAMIGYWDRELRNRFANRAYREWLGVADADLEGRHLRELLGEARFRAKQPYIEAVLRGEPQLFERVTPAPDDGRLRHSLANYIPDTVDGEIYGFFVQVSDISEIREAERHLQLSEARYRAVLEGQTELISRLRADGSYLFVNEAYCRFFGRSRASLIGASWRPVAHADDLPMIEAALAGLSPAQPVVNVENRVFSANGELRWMQFVNRGFFDGAGRLLEIQSVGRDITERKLAELAEREANEQLERRVAERTAELRKLAVDMTLAEENERREIARDLHDDLGQLLHVVRIKLEMLGRMKLSQDGGAMLRQIELLVSDASSRVRSLTAQLSPPVLEKLGLVPALYWLAAEFGELYGLDVAVVADGEGGGFAPVQSSLLFRCARELLVNVARHAGCAAASVSLRATPTAWVLSVSDRGRGCADIDAAMGSGGFGLASIRERIGYLNGSTSLRSVPGEGTEVILSIPRDGENLP